MTIKDATTNSLLMFVAATCVVLIFKALPQTQSANSEDQSGGPAVRKTNGTPSLAVRDGAMVYYLHGNTRCQTCRTIEAYTKEAVESGFAEELKSGSVQWQVVNYESPGNEHYAIDYAVAAPNVVLAMFEDGKQTKWKGLPEVWEHYGDKAVFIAFVQTSLNEFLGKSPAEPSRAEKPPASNDEPQEFTLPIPE
jgi:hypothetical protein